MVLKSLALTSVGLVSWGALATMLPGEPGGWIGALTPIGTMIGTLFTVWFALRKIIKDPVHKLNAMQDRLIHDAIKKNADMIEEHVKKIAQLERERLLDREMFKDTIHTEIEKIKDANQSDRNILNNNISAMQNTITKLDERSSATNDNISQVNSRLAELSAQLGSIISKIVNHS